MYCNNPGFEPTSTHHKLSPFARATSTLKLTAAHFAAVFSFDRNFSPCELRVMLYIYSPRLRGVVDGVTAGLSVWLCCRGLRCDGESNCACLTI